MYNKVCRKCGCAFIGTGPAAKYCSGCREVAKMEQMARDRVRSTAYRVKKGLVKMPGVGSGNAQPVGVDSPSYKHGYYIADRLRVVVRAERRYCERCNQDLRDATQYQWVMHHKDHNHCNNDLSNLELLCKRCHQIEHECHTAFNKRATTIPKGSTLK